MRLLTEEPPCPGCGSPMELMFEFTPHPRLRCSSPECVGYTFRFTPDDVPQPSVGELIRKWKEFRS